MINPTIALNSKYLSSHLFNTDLIFLDKTQYFSAKIECTKFEKTVKLTKTV